MNLPPLLLLLFFFLQAASVSVHQIALDYISNNFPKVVSKCPKLLGALDKFYTILNNAYYKGMRVPELAHIYQRADAMILCSYLLRETPLLEQQLAEVNKLLMMIAEDVRINKTLMMVVNLDHVANQYTFFGFHLRSLVFGTSEIIKSGKSVALSALNMLREEELKEKFSNIPLNTFYTEHLLELIRISWTLGKKERSVNAYVLQHRYESFVDLRTIMFHNIRDPSLPVTTKNSYLVRQTHPPFISKHLNADRDHISIDGLPALSILGLGTQVLKYWNILSTYVIDTKYYDTTLSFAQNADNFRSSIRRLSESWTSSGKRVDQTQRVELRNLCCAYDFLYYYSKLIKVEYEFGSLKNTLLLIIKT